jgi:drug/metabolite transporter (DMT)-like permease
MGWCLVRRLNLRFTLREHAWLALQGVLMFSLNYVFVYLAEQRIASGLTATIFSVTVFLNLLGARIAFDPSPRYLGSLVFLAVFGSVLAFGAYLTLVGRIGAGRAGYTMVAVPLVALALSTLFEGLRWQPALAVGVALCLGGNLLVLPRAPRPAGAAVRGNGQPAD